MNRHSLRGWFKAIAATDGGDFEMQQCVLGVAAIVEYGVGGLVAEADLGEVGCVRAFVVFAEV